MRNRPLYHLVLPLVLVASVFGCGALEGQRSDPELLSGKSDSLSWLKEKPKELQCGDVVADHFAGEDSAHGYLFKAMKDTQVTLTFNATYPASLGSGVVVFDKATGQRLALAKDQSNTVSVSFVPQGDTAYVGGVYSLAHEAKGNYTLRLTCELGTINALTRGQSEFSTWERIYHFRIWGNRVSSVREVKAPQGRSGEVEEADIYKVDNNRLFYLNTYRGFNIYDVQNTKQPKLISRLPIYGYPVEMFIQNNTVYALLSDVLELTQSENGLLKFMRSNTSQLISIDISNLKSPKIQQRVDILGFLKEGVSRKIGDSIYVVSSMPQTYYWGWRNEQTTEPKEQAWVYSFDVKNPAQLRLVEKLKIFEGGSYTEGANGSRESRSFSNVTITATSNALMVVENWYKYGYVANGPECYSSESLQQAVVSLIDLSDSSGKIRLHTRFETYGHIGDQFKQLYLHDAQTGKATYYGIFARQEWSTKNCSGERHVENKLEAWDVSDGNAPKRLDALTFGKPNETVRGSVFDEERKVVFAITAEAIDPLYAISFADPTQLKVTSEINGLSGDMNVFRFIADRKFLLAIGRDTSGACTGFGPNEQVTNVAVSLIDVQDLSNIRLVQRKCVAVEKGSWVNSEVNWNLDQAHKLIGIQSDGIKNVITVPVSYSRPIDDPQGWRWYKSETAVGVMAWDLNRYDPKRKPEEQTVLENFGTVIHPAGSVKRSVLFTHQGSSSRRKMVNLSNTHFSVVDMEDLSKPVTESVVEVAPYVQELFAFGQYVVEQISPGWENYGGNDGSSQFLVKPLGAKIEEQATVASFSVSDVQRVTKLKDHLVVMRSLTRDKNPDTSQTEALIFDLHNPTKPFLAAKIKVPVPYLPYLPLRVGSNMPYSFGSQIGMIALEQGIVFLTASYNPTNGTNASRLVLLDLQNAASPMVKDFPLNVSNANFLSLVGDKDRKNQLYLTYKIKTGKEMSIANTTFEEYNYYTQLYRHQSRDLIPSTSPLSIPGELTHVSTVWNQPLLLTNDRAFELQANNTILDIPRINMLRPKGVTQVKAWLEDFKTFPGQWVNDILVDGSKLYLSAMRAYANPSPIPLSSSETSTTDAQGELLIFSMAWLRFDPLLCAPTNLENLQLLGIDNDWLFLNIAGDGMIVLDVRNPANPKALPFIRTLGGINGLEVVGKTALAASGYYGLQQIDLTN